MASQPRKLWSELLVDVQRRVPVNQRSVQEAFTSDHRHPVLIKLNQAQPETFYWFDELIAEAFFEAVVDWAMRQASGQLTVSYPDYGAARAQAHRLQLAASKLDRVRVLSVGRAGREIEQGARLECSNVARSPLAPYRLALAETRTPLLFVAREDRPGSRGSQRSLGFLSTDPDVISEFADEVEALLHGHGRALQSFERLEVLHQTTQQVARELESYSRRMELAVERARRRPDLLTPARFERIVAQAIAKMEQLKEIPRQALRRVGRPRR
jgi:hypothetical protein